MVGKEIPASGKAASAVEVGVAVAAVDIDVDVGVGVAVAVPVGVAVGVDVGVEVPHRQSVSSIQFGFLQSPDAPSIGGDVSFV